MTPARMREIAEAVEAAAFAMENEYHRARLTEIATELRNEAMPRPVMAPGRSRTFCQCGHHREDHTGTPMRAGGCTGRNCTCPRWVPMDVNDVEPMPTRQFSNWLCRCGREERGNATACPSCGNPIPPFRGR